MGAQGQTTINFGSFPGTTDTTVVITGQNSISATSLVEAWIQATTTSDHSVDEHWIDFPLVTAGNIVAGTGFTIYGIVNSKVDANDADSLPYKRNAGNNRSYGQWTVNWVWN